MKRLSWKSEHTWKTFKLNCSFLCIFSWTVQASAVYCKPLIDAGAASQYLPTLTVSGDFDNEGHTSHLKLSRKTLPKCASVICRLNHKPSLVKMMEFFKYSGTVATSSKKTKIFNRRFLEETTRINHGWYHLPGPYIFVSPFS